MSLNTCSDCPAVGLRADFFAIVEQDDRGLRLQGPVPEGRAGDLPLLRGQEVHVRQQLQGGGGVPQVRNTFIPRSSVGDPDPRKFFGLADPDPLVAGIKLKVRNLIRIRFKVKSRIRIRRKTAESIPFLLLRSSSLINLGRSKCWGIFLNLSSFKVFV